MFDAAHDGVQPILLLGNTFDEALDTLIVGRMPQRVNFYNEDYRWKKAYKMQTAVRRLYATIQNHAILNQQQHSRQKSGKTQPPMTPTNRWKIALLLAVPVGLYFVLAAQMSWRPRIIEIGWDVEDVVFSPDGKSLAVGGSRSNAGMAGIWDVGSRKQLQLVKADCRIVMHVALSPDKRKLAGVCWDEITGFVWEAPTGKLLRSDYEKMGKENALYSLSWARYPRDYWLFNQRLRSPDGSLMAVSNDNKKSLKLFDTKTGKLLRTLNGHTNVIFAVAFSPDSSMLATGSWDETVMLWRIK